MSEFKPVWVERDGVPYECTSEEQLKLFLDAGYKAFHTTEAKTATKKTTKAKKAE